jgi:hypothetical protein
MQAVNLVYVDNPDHTQQVLKLAFPDLGKGFYDGDSGIRGDLFHMIDRTI